MCTRYVFRWMELLPAVDQTQQFSGRAKHRELQVETREGRAYLCIAIGVLLYPEKHAKVTSVCEHAIFHGIPSKKT